MRWPLLLFSLTVPCVPPALALPQQAPRFLALQAPAEATPRPVGLPLFPGDLPWLQHDEEVQELSSRAAVTAEEWRRWLEEAAASLMPRVRLRGTETGLLAEGAPEDLTRLAQLSREVEDCLEARTLEGRATLTLGDEILEVPLALRSGDLTSLSITDEREFVGTWNAEVAADSAVAEPAIWRLRSGWSLHLAAAAAGRDGVRVHGRLERTLPGTLEPFDPDTPDLGALQRPRVERTLVEFAGYATAESPLRVEATGPAPVALELRFTAPDELPSPGGWTVVDAAALGLPLPWNESYDGPGWSASALAAMLASPLAEASVLWAGELLLVPPGADALAAQAKEFLSALRAPQRPATAEVVSGDGRGGRIPLLHGVPGGLRQEVLTTQLVGYRTELATDAWIAEPTMIARRTGLALTLHASATSLAGVGSQTHEQERGQVAADALAQIGALEWGTLRRRPFTLRQATGSEPWSLAARAPLPRLTVRQLP
ncbi:MAG: hypothetical protein ISQ08_06960 [Planctomycetes bacterium]|nr:hypothetical protein [Planctomycetota bacterium]